MSRSRIPDVYLVPWMAFAALIFAGQASGDSGLTVNKWMRLPSTSGPDYVWSSPVYVPSRGQVLHWGSTDPRTGGPLGFNDGKSRNDVVALDPATGDWVSDYPSDEKAPVGIAGGKAIGAMLPSGRPRPSHVMHGGCYDSKRDQVIYTMRGLMAAYDPKARTWKDMQAKTLIPGTEPGTWKTVAGGPPVYGVGACYDPVNDEIILFPHFDAKNIALRDATGQITGHYGTFRYSFQNNTWRTVGDTFGSDDVKRARRELIAAMATASKAMDSAWVLNRRPDEAKAAEVGKVLGSAAAACKVSQPAAGELLGTAAAALAANKPADAIKPLRDALWAMNESLDSKLRVEPPPRCGAPMVYDPKNELIVMFGGYTNLARTDLARGTPNVQGYDTGLNDTWVYDCKTRQWRELPCAARPPAGTFISKMPMLAYDPQSGLVVLVGLAGGAKQPNKAEIWSLDAAKGEWLKRDEQDWPGELSLAGGGGYPATAMPMSLFGFDTKDRLLVVTQPLKDGQATCVLKLDLDKLPSAPAPAWVAPSVIKPQEIPADNPAWVAKLRSLPANTWVQAKPASEPVRRDWGNLSVDPVRGWVVYFGGGHATWQVNDVAVYAVGANAWVPAVGDFNSYITPQPWEGSTLGYRGGPACGHQRNGYQSFDGRMYLLLGTDEDPSAGKALWNPWNYTFHAERDFVRFYDIDRGGVWREMRIAKIERPDKVPYQTNVNLVDPDGRVINLIRLGGGATAKLFVSIYEVNEDKLTVQAVPAPLPAVWEIGESRPFCYLTGQNKIFYMSGKPDERPDAVSPDPKDPKKKPLVQTSYVYDLKENRFSELSPAHTPPAGGVQVVEYVESQKCALAVIGGRQWVYSFAKNDWAELPLNAEGGKMGFQGPYGQMVWVARYGVFVNLVGSTWIMRPDFTGVFGNADTLSPPAEWK